jgi:hypothetical protein
LDYTPVDPPISRSFRECSREELRAYARWFRESLPERERVLEKAVRSTPGFEGWEADATPESLDGLGRWLETRVETRERTREELAQAFARSGGFDHAERELTARTLSIVWDVAMYFARVILRSLPGTRWDLILRAKRHVDYGQPVLAGFGKVPLNPVQLIMTNVYSVMHGRRTDLPGTYRRWALQRSE